MAGAAPPLWRPLKPFGFSPIGRRRRRGRGAPSAAGPKLSPGKGAAPFGAGTAGCNCGDLRESILRDEGLRLIGIVNGPLYGHLNWPLLVDALRPLLVDALRLFLVGALRLLMLRDEVFAAVVVRIAVVIALEWLSVAEPAAAVHLPGWSMPCIPPF